MSPRALQQGSVKKKQKKQKQQKKQKKQKKQKTKKHTNKQL